MTKTLNNKKFIKGEVSFEDWCKELSRVAPIIAPKVWGEPMECGEEAWQGYFDSGFEPDEAILEDLSYGN